MGGCGVEKVEDDCTCVQEQFYESWGDSNSWRQEEFEACGTREDQEKSLKLLVVAVVVHQGHGFLELVIFPN